MRWIASPLLAIAAAAVACGEGADRDCPPPANVQAVAGKLAFAPVVPCWMPTTYKLDTTVPEAPDQGGLSHGLTLTYRAPSMPDIVFFQADHDPGYQAINIGAQSRKADVNGVEARLDIGVSGSDAPLLDLRWSAGGRYYQLQALSKASLDEDVLLRIARSVP